jgi:hypothetical protein
MMNEGKAHQVWTEQCEAAETIKERFGLKAAFDYPRQQDGRFRSIDIRRPLRGSIPAGATRNHLWANIVRCASGSEGLCPMGKRPAGGLLFSTGIVVVLHGIAHDGFCASDPFSLRSVHGSAAATICGGWVAADSARACERHKGDGGDEFGDRVGRNLPLGF